MKKIVEKVGQKFPIATGILMTRMFSTQLPANPRRLMFACGPVMRGPCLTMPNPM